MSITRHTTPRRCIFGGIKWRRHWICVCDFAFSLCHRSMGPVLYAATEVTRHPMTSQNAPNYSIRSILAILALNGFLYTFDAHEFKFEMSVQVIFVFFYSGTLPLCFRSSLERKSEVAILFLQKKNNKILRIQRTVVLRKCNMIDNVSLLI